MITMYYVLWATKAKQDYIGTYVSKATALEVAAALDLPDFLVEEVNPEASITAEIR